MKFHAHELPNDGAGIPNSNLRCDLMFCNEIIRNFIYPYDEVSLNKHGF